MNVQGPQPPFPTPEVPMAPTATTLVAGLNFIHADSGYTFYVEPNGRKYTKISQTHGGINAGGKSVYCFFENATGLLYKAAGWKAPAAIPRHDVSTVEKMADFIANKSDVYGGCFYIR